jgi:hypothetical protein
MLILIYLLYNETTCRTLCLLFSVYKQVRQQNFLVLLLDMRKLSKVGRQPFFTSLGLYNAYLTSVQISKQLREWYMNYYYPK